MSSLHSPDPRGSSRALSLDLPPLVSRSSVRFGALSHHSFFSRHNPHPNRVRHIQGLNGRPVCSVRDDWFGASPLFPHPLLKGNMLRKGPDPSLSHTVYGASANKTKANLLSEKWRDELKELTTRISTSPQTQREKKEVRPKEEPVRRQTQYSAQTGRLIPPSSKSTQRRSYTRSQHKASPHGLLQDQELMVLELLCQILQTDSLSTVQQWLLLAGQREKDLVMGMIKQALEGTDLQNPDLRLYPHLPPQYNPSTDPTWRLQHGLSPERKLQKNSTPAHEKPDKIGEAEVLQIHDAEEATPEPLP
ncbi:protein TBATA [Boleophthalmus pectinirostris]|uniref:protein TBATA n=1 Tax=Boleophthalmus pectinirostris TaxID=150288 RepID=UPI00242AE5F9|nr:protein TBATA [Boleophthalmus pectinirostris]